VLTCADLAIRSVQAVIAMDLGVPAEKILGGGVVLFDSAYPDDRRRLDFLERAEGRIAALPGVGAAAVTTRLPGSFTGSARLEVEGKATADGRGYRSRSVAISPAYFDVVGKPLLAGRAFTAADDGSNPVAIVNRLFVNRLFVERLLGGGDAHGRGTLSSPPPAGRSGSCSSASTRLSPSARSPSSCRSPTAALSIFSARRACSAGARPRLTSRSPS
jgi:putative ABC transport system permease protein